MPSTVPFFPSVAHRGLVCAADQLAASAGSSLLDRGGSAADGAVGAAAVMAVVGPHLCGLGGDMLAVVKAPDEPARALLGVGRTGSGADADRLRADGHSEMPLRGDIRTVPVPGAVDGWLALHAGYGRLPWTEVLEPAVALAQDGFAASLLLALASHLVATSPRATELCPAGPVGEGEVVRLPGIARTLTALASEGRDGFYGGEFGTALIELGRGEYVASDLAEPAAEWVEPVHAAVFGHELWAVPPPSQGYLTLAGAMIAERVGLPDDPDDPRWAHVVVEAANAAGADRPDALFESADGKVLLAPDRLAARAASIASDRASGSLARSVGSRSGQWHQTVDGDTTHLCVVDAEGLGVSLTQSNALDLGSHLVAGDTGVFLHNRGIGFSLRPGHPAEYGPGRRPPHTLSPALVTSERGDLQWVIGTMGGDSQPQILLQLLARVLRSGQDPATALAAPRVLLSSPGAPPFRLWDRPNRALVTEAHAGAWRSGLEERGHRVTVVSAFDPVAVGCAQLIGVARTHGELRLTGASDPRSPGGAAIGR